MTILTVFLVQETGQHERTYNQIPSYLAGYRMRSLECVCYSCATMPSCNFLQGEISVYTMTGWYSDCLWAWRAPWPAKICCIAFSWEPILRIFCWRSMNSDAIGQIRHCLCSTGVQYRGVYFLSAEAFMRWLSVVCEPEATVAKIVRGYTVCLLH